MHAERLLKVAELLDDVKPSRFDMENWTCGTAACAIGHAAYAPWFNARGFYMSYGAGNRAYTTPCLIIDQENGYVVRSWEAVERFFQITEKQSQFLFQMKSYAGGDDLSPASVAARIRKFVKYGRMMR